MDARSILASTHGDAIAAPSRRSRLDVAALLILAAAVAVAAIMYGHFLEVSRYYWTGIGHDRHAHCYIGLRLAADVAEGRVVEAVKDLLFGSGVWGPLHGVLLAGVELAGGFDYRLAVVPSLAGFVATAFFGFLAARRLVPHGGNLAGMAAAVFILASPAHRAFATDVMLESLGAGLSLMVLYFYLVVVQDGVRWAGRCLALALTALFFHKSNYYMLIALALVAAELAARPQAYLTAIRAAWHRVAWADWLRAQLRQPLNYLLAALVLLVGVVWLRGDEPFIFFNQHIRIYPPYNVMTVVYAVLFIQLALWWRQHGRDLYGRCDPRCQPLLAWHLLPVLMSFLVPTHIRDFLAYLTRNHGRDGFDHPLLGGLPFYGECLAHDYHLGVGSLLLAAGLLFVALLAWRRLRPGAGVVLSCVLIAGLLTCYHPSHRSRFLHSWIAATWLLSGAGLALLLSGRLVEDWGRARGWLAGCAGIGLVLAHLSGVLQPGHAPEAGPLPMRCSWLDVTDAYLPELAEARRVTILSSVPLIRFLADWTYLERYHQRSRLENHWFGFGPPGDANRRSFEHWLRTTSCDTLVFVERLPEATDFDFTLSCHQLHEQLLDVLQTQTLFRCVDRQRFPQAGCRVTIWRKAGDLSVDSRSPNGATVHSQGR